MAPAAVPGQASQHSRSHALLLLQKLLNLRDGASPLTLVLDSLEQSAAPVVREFILRAQVGRGRATFPVSLSLSPLSLSFFLSLPLSLSFSLSPSPSLSLSLSLSLFLGPCDPAPFGGGLGWV
jgi:hypothetical protein